MPTYKPIEWTDFAIADLADEEVEDTKLRRFYRQTDPNRLKLFGAMRALAVEEGVSIGPLTTKPLVESVRNFTLATARKHRIKIVTRCKPGQNGQLYLHVVRVG